jgi:hypothetical protein
MPIWQREKGGHRGVVAQKKGEEHPVFSVTAEDGRVLFTFPVKTPGTNEKDRKRFAREMGDLMDGVVALKGGKP